MSQLGARLREARESQSLTLQQAAAGTRIREQSLAALEEGQHNMLPNDVVAKGFVRNYANYLGLPAEEMVALYRQETGASQPIQVVAASNAPRSRSYVLPSFFAVFFITIALVGLAYFSLNALGYIRDEPEIAIEATNTPIASTPTPLNRSSAEVALPTAVDDTAAGIADEPAGTPAPTLTPSPFVIPTADPSSSEPTSTPSPSPTQEAPIVLEVSVSTESIEGSWLRVTADGVIVYEQIMPPGDRQVFLAQRQVSVRAGNPTFVEVGVNGLPPETLGQVSGEPIDWFWPPQ